MEISKSVEYKTIHIRISFRVEVSHMSIYVHELRDGSHCGLIFSMSRHKLSHKYVATFTPQESWRSHVRDINDI